ncbi:hypothetical protein VIGAN_09113800, partial [Vigna angularis var. angularis]
TPHNRIHPLPKFLLSNVTRYNTSGTEYTTMPQALLRDASSFSSPIFNVSSSFKLLFSIFNASSRSKYDSNHVPDQKGQR